MIRSSLLCTLLVLASCDGPQAQLPDSSVSDPPTLDAGRPVIDPPPPAQARGCGWDEPPTGPADLFAGEWDRGFMLPGLGGRTPAATAIAPLDDGSIVVGGSFASVGTLRVANIARWHPAEGWAPLGDGFEDEVAAVATDGVTIYAATSSGGGGWIPSPSHGTVYRFTDGGWDSLGAFDGKVETLEVGADGALYAGGSFADVAGVPVANLARFHDGAWEALHPEGPDGGVHAILIEADSLCVGGMFGMVGAVESLGAACLVDGVWEARSLPDYGSVSALARDPSDGTLIAGGHFPIDPTNDDLGGSIARWTGSAWELIAGGLHNFGMIGPAYVEGVEIIDGVLHVAGAFGFGGTGADLVPLESVAALGGDGRWDDLAGGLRKRLGVSLGTSNVLATAVDSNGRLIAGGIFSLAGSQSVIGIAAWDGAYWRGLATADRPPVGGINGGVEAMASMDRCALYVGGNFVYAGDVRANNVARFDHETGWHALGEGLPYPVVALAVTDRVPADGPDSSPGATRPIGGPHGALYAAGMTDTGSNALMLWDGYTWREVGMFDGGIRAIAVAEDGTVIVGGEFTRVGEDQPALHIARWDGRRWGPLESGVDGRVGTLHFLDDGRLLVGGNFFSAGGAPAGGAAVWDGERWESLGEGLEGAFSAPSVSAFVVLDGTIYAGGDFVSSDGRAMENVARFDGTDWHPVGAGLPGLFVLAMSNVGDALVAAGHFQIDGEESTFAAFVDGAWTPFHSGTDDLVTSMEPRPEGIYLGGPFVNAADVPSVGVALYRYPEIDE